MNPELKQQFSQLKWINTDLPQTPDQYKGKVCLVLFFTHSSAASMLWIPKLQSIIQENEDAVGILGVHCPKFSHEKDSNALQRAINRHYIRFPVAQDPDFLLWQQLGAEGWPSLVVLDTQGKFVGRFQGVDQLADVQSLVEQLLDAAIAQDTRDFSEIAAVTKPEPEMPLRFPAGIAVSDKCMYIADTGHNRILETDHEGQIKRIFGSGSAGLWDGTRDDAGFNQPQGLCLGDERLYVADTGNHSIRQINLFSGAVETLAGNGDFDASVEDHVTNPRDVGLAMPTDVQIAGDKLYITMAASNQIWRYDLGINKLGRFSGTGFFGLQDGPNQSCAFSQPMSVTESHKLLFVADANNSAIRVIRESDGASKTIIGKGPYIWGDGDGGRENALLQYPTAITAVKGSMDVWVADTFNNALRKLDIRQKTLTTLSIRYRLKEPRALTVHNGEIWVANTNAHDIVRVDTKTGRCRSVLVEAPTMENIS